MSKGYGSRRTRKGPIIFGIVIVLIIGGLVGYKVYEAKAAAKIAAVQAAQEAAKVKKEREAYAKEKAAAEAKVIADAKIAADAKAAADSKATADAQVIEDAKKDEENVYIRMHGLINTKIVSKDGLRYGLIPITTADCDELIKIVNDNNYADKEKLLQYLNSWKKEDFSNAVAQHNYIWDKLGRGEGEAIAVIK